MNQRALVIEPNFSGHRWRYVQWTIEALIEAGYECILSTAEENRDHMLIRSYEAACSGVVVVFHDGEPIRRFSALTVMGLAKEDFTFYSYFASAYRSVTLAYAVNLVVVPYGDYILNAVAILGTPFAVTEWVCITMQQTFHLREIGVLAPRRQFVDSIKRRLFFRALRRGNLAAVWSIDPTLSRWYATSPLAQRGPTIDYLPDPFPEVRRADRPEAKARLGINAEHSILVYGAITERKGIKELLNACLLRERNPLIVIAGEQSDSIRKFLASIRDQLTHRVVIFDHFISPEMERDLFSACDVVWVGYKGHYGMSGVLVQAFRFEKPVIATSSGLIGWFATKDKLGPVIDDLSSSSINNAIDDAMNCISGNWVDWCGKRPRILSLNTVANFKNTLKSTIFKARGRLASVGA